MKYIFTIFIPLFLISCQQEAQQTKEQLAAQEQKKEQLFKTLSQAWNIQKPMQNPEVTQNLTGWKQWNAFETEIFEKPKSSITAFKLKTKNISQRVDSLFIKIPIIFDKPEIRSRLITLKTKIKMLETFVNLDSIPLSKTQKIIQEINQELNSINSQWNEIIIKNKIPKEIGEEEMLMLLDTVRRANPKSEK